jgi:hypothetical protein
MHRVTQHLIYVYNHHHRHHHHQQQNNDIMIIKIIIQTLLLEIIQIVFIVIISSERRLLYMIALNSVDTHKQQQHYTMTMKAYAYQKIDSCVLSDIIITL